ncbi:UDP-glycosyltransferase 87A1 [Capsicum chacoense]|uniref:UDP-glycosyltransferase 87A1 n=1 Tax=Capsicum annuum TaxID=4072 RepID=UPI001FB120DB|nr:UDP-glycosyltransferase 87A1 [Capsicum annuum]KAF3646958.1 putative UDP-glycosyltransferase 87A2-like [Capsicum annuum]
METAQVDQGLCCHILAIPYPGRGHINPLMNLCKLIASTTPNLQLVITFIVTEEWFSFLKSEPKPASIQFRTIPNVIPSEKDRNNDLIGFVEAVYTKMEAPVESLLDGLLKANVIIADMLLPWVLRIGERRNIPVASFWTTSVTIFSIFYQLLLDNEHFDASLIEQGEEQVNYIPGITPIRLKDLPSVCHDKHLEILPFLLEVVSESVNKAQYALFTTIEALESQVIEALRAKFPVPIFTVGPTIPYFDTEFKTNQPSSNYFSWLDDQPKDSVLYISQGSFMSVSKEQLDEIIAGVHSSGVRSFWVARENTSLLKEAVGNKGIIVPWCDQLKVLCHPSVGGFWSHCGWNSIKEGAYAGIPFLTFPIGADQFTNSKQIVEDWKIGWRINKEMEKLVKRDEIAMLLRSFMDLDNYHGKEMRRRAMEIRKTCQEAIEGGAIQGHIDKFIRDISHGPRH